MQTDTLLMTTSAKHETNPGDRRQNPFALVTPTSINVAHGAGLKLLTALLILLTGWLAVKVGIEAVGLHNDLNGLTNALNQAATR